MIVKLPNAKVVTFECEQTILSSPQWGNYSSFYYIREMKTWTVSSLDEFKKE